MFVGKVRVGWIDPIQSVQCPLAEAGAWVETNAQGTWINADGDMNDHYGFARRTAAGTWKIYSSYLRPRHLVGVAKQRDSRRWDVFKGTHLFGYTLGPDGPQAATALLTICT